MFQIAYFSTAAEPQEPALIDAILARSRLDNLRDDISGLLVAGGNRYLQVIEGRRQAVEALYGRIRGDHRHIAVTTLVKRNVQVRCFDGWAMAYRRDTRLGVFDSFPVVLGYLTDQVADLRLRGQIRQFAKSFIVQPVANTPELWRMAS